MLLYPQYVEYMALDALSEPERSAKLDCFWQAIFEYLAALRKEFSNG